ncbi:MAG: hypothetical protein K2X11_18845, partial [Acetobacteraceae bacterium]|nr:hypothetical protein [Acetobacteraceae bacterium]
AARNARNQRPQPEADPDAPRPVQQAAAATRMPTLFAGNGGTPQPEIGFLGFDAGRTGGPAASPRPAVRGERGWSP